MKRIILSITGASCSLFAVEFLKLMHKEEVEVHGIISEAGRLVLKHEMGMAVDDLTGLLEKWHDCRDFAAPMSSGSSRFDAMVVLPCSMGTLAAVANGISANLIHRAADVTLKQKRPLVLAVRETPFNRTHLRNMLQVNDAGATIFPIMPALYHEISSIQEAAADFAGRVADFLGIEVAGLKRWPEGE